MPETTSQTPNGDKAISRPPKRKFPRPKKKINQSCAQYESAAEKYLASTRAGGGKAASVIGVRE